VRELKVHWKMHEKWTALGFGALAFALVKGCPGLEEFALQSPDPNQDPIFLRTVVEGMLQAAGREVYLIVC